MFDIEYWIIKMPLNVFFGGVKMMRCRWLFLLLIALMVVFCVSCGDDDDDSADDTGDDADDDDDNDDDDNDTQGGQFQVGFSKVDITPQDETIMAGYGAAFFLLNNCRWSTGVHDPLYAHAVAFDDPASSKEAILIVLDNVGTITNDIVLIQQGIAQELGIDPGSVVVAATHTHGGPDTIGLYGVIVPPITGRQDEVIDLMIQGAIEAGVEAWENRVPATLEYATGQEPRLHFNKIFFDFDKVIDSTMTMLAAYDADGNLIGSLMNWAAHPTLLPAGNTLLTADYPGAYYKAMDESLGGIHMYVNGAIGASIQVLPVENPWVKWLLGTTNFDDWDDIGAVLMEDALDLMENAKPVEHPSIWLQESRSVQVIVENIAFWLASEVELIPREVPPLGQYGETYMSTFAIGPITFGTMPGEYGPNYSFILREILGGDAQVLIGLGMDWVGYAILPEQYQSLPYLYERFLCPSSQAGEELMAVYHEIWDPVHGQD